MSTTEKGEPLKDCLISEITSHLEHMRGRSVIAQKNLSELKPMLEFGSREQETLGHLIEHLTAVNRQLNSYVLLMESYRT